MIKRIFIGFLSITLLGFMSTCMAQPSPETPNAWQRDGVITSGLSSAISMYRAPTVFQKDSTWYLIEGENGGTFDGYNWTGTTWQSDTGIASGLGDVGTESAPSTFQKDSTWYLIAGEGDGLFNGYNWTGTTWQSDTGIASGLGDVGTSSKPEVFQKNSTWYLIAGERWGGFEGYNWTGTTWQSDTGIASGLPTGPYGIGDGRRYPTLSVFQKDSTWYLIAGKAGGTYSGYNWTGTTWQSDTGIASGLGPDNQHTAPEVFQKNSTWYLIAGEGLYGNHAGYNWGVTNTYTVYVKEESDFTTPLYSNITFSNSTDSITYYNVTESEINSYDISGDITITAVAINDSYEPRSFEDSFPQGLGTFEERTFYLPLTSTGSYINLNIQDALGLEINGAIVTTSKRNGGTYTEIDQATTYETGTIIVFMETGISHKIDVTKTGYLDKTQYITATLSSYDITLSQSTTYLNDTTELAGLTIYQTPSQTALRENDAEEFVVKITSNSTLDWWSVDYLQDDVSISGLTNYTADSNGGTNVTTLNTTNRNGTIVSRIQYQVDGYGPRTFETNYTIYKIDDSDFSLKNIITGIDAKDYGNYGGMVVGFLALIITILIMATIGFEYPLTTLIGMIVLGFFAFMEWLDINIYFLALIGILAYLFIRRSV